MKKSIFSLLLLMLPMLAVADIIEVDGISYVIVNSDHSAAVNKKNGGYTGDIVIPATITYNGQTYNVVEVLSYAFSGNDELKSVTLPESVVELRDCIFYGAHGLETVKMPRNVQKMGNSTFAGCTSLKTFWLPDNATEVRYGTFNGCESLTEMKLPETVTTIGESAFYGCEGIKTITIPAGVTKIEDTAFYNCNPKDVYCYAEEVPETGDFVFDLLDFEGVTLHVPASALNAYKDNEAWNVFETISAIR